MEVTIYHLISENCFFILLIQLVYYFIYDQRRFAFLIFQPLMNVKHEPTVKRRKKNIKEDRLSAKNVPTVIIYRLKEYKGFRPVTFRSS